MKKLYLALLLGVIGGCMKEKCVVCPPDQPPAEKEYYFLYAGSFSMSAYIYSTVTGQIVDSVLAAFWDVRFSKDGKLVYYLDGEGSLMIADFLTDDTISVGSGLPGHWLSISSDDHYLLISEAATVRLVTLPALSVIYQREHLQHSEQWGRGTIHPFENIAYVAGTRDDSLLIIDFRDDSDIHVTLISLHGGQFSYQVDLTKDGKTLILSASRYLQLRDSKTLDLLHQYYFEYDWCYLHPDGNRLFLIKRQEFERGVEAAVWVLDLRTLLATRILHGDDFRAYFMYYALTPTDMDFTPDGKYAFIISGQSGQESGTGAILKLDCDTYKIVDAFYPPPGVSGLIRVNPKEISAPLAH